MTVLLKLSRPGLREPHPGYGEISAIGSLGETYVTQGECHLPWITF